VDARPEIEPPPTDVSAGSEAAAQARALANEGQLSAALAATERWITAERLDAAAHYLRAMIQQELGDVAAARGSLQRALYLQPDFALAHFALGNCARAEARGAEANRHFQNALRVLSGRPPDEPVPESDGQTAGRLTEIITALVSPGERLNEERKR
jgi:chemotaxis protein methyltransferase CheR